MARKVSLLAKELLGSSDLFGKMGVLSVSTKFLVIGVGDARIP